MERRLQASARVVAVSGKQAELRLTAPSACGGCGAQGACGGARERQAQFRVPAGFAAGDLVTLEMSESSLNLGAMAAYLLPACCTLFGALLLAPGGDALAALGAGLGLGFGIVCLRLVARNHLIADVRVCPSRHEFNTLPGEHP